MRLPSALLSKLASDLRASYWFIPTTLVVCAIILALCLSWIDKHPGTLPFALPDAMLDTQVEGARSVLSVIATSIIGVAGVMFSVTIVAVSFASGNYGPRLIGNFMRDRGNQWSLGILISTFVYALIVLREIQGPAGETEFFVPQYALWMAIALALLAVGTMIYFVHHIPETINVSNITSDLGRKLCAAVATCDLDLPDYKATKVPSSSAPKTTVHAKAPGYVQTVDVAGIAEQAQGAQIHITLLVRPGTFVAAGDPLFTVRGDGVDEAAEQALTGTVALGTGPTEAQNTDFIAQQLVEMIARALSPGVNDPFTAINCLNWLYAGLAKKAKHPLEPSSHDLVTIPDRGFTDLLEASFAASLPYTKDDIHVSAHLRDLLEKLRNHTSGPDSAAVTRLLKKI